MMILLHRKLAYGPLRSVTEIALPFTVSTRCTDVSMMLIRSLSLCCRKPTQNETDWPTYTKEHPKYYILNAERTGTGKGPRTTACAFWNDFLPRLRTQQGEFPGKARHSELSRFRAGVDTYHSIPSATRFSE
jgi:hypothetical protein